MFIVLGSIVIAHFFARSDVFKDLQGHVTEASLPFHLGDRAIVEEIKKRNQYGEPFSKSLREIVVAFLFVAVGMCNLGGEGVR